MASITVYGASDDLIEVDGALSEEFNALRHAEGGDDGGILAFSDGTLLEIRYTSQGDGIWRITPIHVPDPELLTITQAPLSDDKNYTDRAELRSDCDWVVIGSSYTLNRH